MREERSLTAVIPYSTAPVFGAWRNRCPLVLMTFGTAKGLASRVPFAVMQALVTIASNATTICPLPSSRMAPLSERLAEIRRTLFLLEIAERLALLRDQRAESQPDVRDAARDASLVML
jgi:hypothetical protein